MALFDAFEAGYDGSEDSSGEDEPTAGDRTEASVGDGRRKGRPAMPSWDEIVFGARTEDS